MKERTLSTERLGPGIGKKMDDARSSRFKGKTRVGRFVDGRGLQALVKRKKDEDHDECSIV